MDLIITPEIVKVWQAIMDKDEPRVRGWVHYVVFPEV